MCGKEDWVIRIDESDIKFEGTAELKIGNEQLFIETVIILWEIIAFHWKCEIQNWKL